MKALSLHSIPLFADYPGKSQDDPLDLAAQIQALVPGYTRLPASVLNEDLLIIQDKAPLRPTQRLVVLIPPGKIDETTLVSRVWQLAASSSFNVLYLTLSADTNQIIYYRRRVATLAAMTRSQNVRAHGSVSIEKNWHRSLNQTLQAGDLLVCLSSHKVSKFLVWRKPLGELLATALGVPVYLVGGFTIGSSPQAIQAVKEVIAWTAFLAILGAFFGVQASIDSSLTKPLSTFLNCLSVMVEIYLLWKINEWIR